MTQELNVGDKIKVFGWVMMKGLDDNRIYKVIKQDAISYTFKHKQNKPIRHYKDNIHLWIKSNDETDLNHIKKINNQ